MCKPVIQRPRISIAPMLDWTTRHCRYFHRILTPHALLYTEMVTTGALLHGDRDRHLAFHPTEHPVALQLGGSSPEDLARCTEMGALYGYDEINLNCGCPSDRVQQGRFGACLMKEPETVAACVFAMKQTAPLIPITVKCRIGVDDYDDITFLDRFITTVKQAGCSLFILHARKAWLKGLSPKENREIPPLRYEIAAEIKARHPEVQIILNGGLKTIDSIQQALFLFDGIMIGRAAYETPYFLAEIEKFLYGTPLPDRSDVLRALIPYIIHHREQDPSFPINAVLRHTLGLFHGQKGARAFRRILTESVKKPEITVDDLISRALEAVNRND